MGAREGLSEQVTTQREDRQMGDRRDSRGPGQTLTKSEVSPTELGRRGWLGTEQSQESI